MCVPTQTFNISQVCGSDRKVKTLKNSVLGNPQCKLIKLVTKKKRKNIWIKALIMLLQI